tara:strand:+ start:4319 stop:5104 length:786 start_codon:yes stop_codon:yes gene_type:complete
LLHVAEAKRTLGSSIEWICDNIKNEFKQALGGAPNSQFVIDPDGKIINASSWSNPTGLRETLAGLVGEVSPPTTVEELGLKQLPPPRLAATGVMVRPQMPGPMRAIVVKPQPSLSPYYVKLRAEIGSGFMQDGLGWMYIGFHLDPLLGVHWNNLAPPLQFRIKTPAGLCVASSQGKAPVLKEEADADPREFLLGLEWDSKILSRTEFADAELILEVDYYACHNDGWCRPFQQRYHIQLMPDRNGGSVRSRGRPGGGGFRNR